jgi:hypothetical protein
MILVPQEHALAKNIDRDHLLRTHRRSDGLAFLGESFSRGDVKLVLVLETAEQPTTTA